MFSVKQRIAEHNHTPALTLMRTISLGHHDSLRLTFHEAFQSLSVNNRQQSAKSVVLPNPLGAKSRVNCRFVGRRRSMVSGRSRSSEAGVRSIGEPAAGDTGRRQHTPRHYIQWRGAGLRGPPPQEPSIPDPVAFAGETKRGEGARIHWSMSGARGRRSSWQISEKVSLKAIL